MKLVGVGWVAILCGMCLHSPVWAGDFWHRCYIDARRMNSWPDPFRMVDREAARAPFEVMKDAGWRLENTLVDALFTDEQELTRAGKIKIRHILTQVPLHRRTIYVLEGETTEITEKRVDTVQRVVADMVPDGQLPPVLVTQVVPRGGAGEYLNLVNRKYRESIPPPVLPEPEGSGDSGGN